MGVKEDYPETVKRLIELEATVADLYSEYAAKFPDTRDFWNGLVREEHNHAGLLLTLTKGDAGSLGFNPERFDIDTIRKYLDFVKERLEEARRGEVTIDEALNTALGIEQSVVERTFYAVFDGDSAGLREALLRISQETRQHRSKVQKMMEAKRKATR